MRTNLIGYGGLYEPVSERLTDDQIREAFYQISLSDRFDLGDQSHIVLRGTDRIVGYIGNSSLELCCPKGENPERYRIPHKHLRRIFKATLKTRIFGSFVN